MDEIAHKGRILGITPSETVVEIVRSSACSACHARSLCPVTDSETKSVSVPTDPYTFYSVGDEVELCVKKSMGLKAVRVSYIYPLFVLVAFLALSLLLGAGELAGGLSAIAAVAVYYVVVFLLKNRLENEIVFYIKKYD